MRKTKFKRKIINAEQRDRERVCVCGIHVCACSVHLVCKSETVCVVEGEESRIFAKSQKDSSSSIDGHVSD